MRYNKIVLVNWVDSVSYDGWRSNDEVKKTDYEEGIQCVSVGFLIKKTKKVLVICKSQCATGDGTNHTIFTIPMKAVMGISEISIGGL